MGFGLSDHFAIHANVCLEKHSYPCKEITYRKLLSISCEKLRNDIIYTPLVRDYLKFTSVADIVESYMKQPYQIYFILTRLPKKRIVTPRPASPWFNDDIVALKKTKRRIERRWHAFKLTVDRILYVQHCSKYNTAIFDSKMRFYSDVINEHNPTCDSQKKAG